MTTTVASWLRATAAWLDGLTTPNGQSWVIMADKDEGRLRLYDGVELGGIKHARLDEVQPLDAELSAIAGLTSASNKLIRFTGSGTADLLDLDTDGTLAANSDTVIATQKAVKTYADALLAANDAMVYRGATDCSTNPNYPAANRGDTYRVSVAGKIGGASGVTVEAGDFFICNTDSTAGGDQAAVGANWNVIQTNIVGAYFAGGTDVAKADGGTGASDGRGAATNLSLPYVIGQGTVAAHTGTTDETAQATITIPANAPGPTGCIDVEMLWQWDNTANDKIPRIRLGGIGGTVFWTITATTSATAHVIARICNITTGAQRAFTNAAYSNGASAALTTGTVDTTSAQDLVISAQLESGSESMTLVHYRVTITPSAGN